MVFRSRRPDVTKLSTVRRQKRWGSFRQPIKQALVLIALVVAATVTIRPDLVGLNRLSPAPQVSEQDPSQFEAAAGTLKVVDGDTVRFRGRRLRLLNIDAPEVRDYRCPAELDAGRRAKEALEQLIAGKAITIRFSGDHDQYGRDLVDLIVEGQDIAQVLIDRKLALPFGRGKNSAGAHWCGAP